MQIEVTPVDVKAEVNKLIEMDAEIFPAADRFDEPSLWEEYEVFWIKLDGRIVGDIALGHDIEFGGSWDNDKPSPGCLYLASIAILPEFQRRGIGSKATQWEIDYARSHGFRKISLNCRESNAGSLCLHQKFGFKIIGKVPDYYRDPTEATIVLEHELD